jgi:hypothetical protein
MATNDRRFRRDEELARPLRARARLVDVPQLLKRRAAHKHARNVSARNRRKLAQWLRTICVRADEPDPIARRHSVLLHDRAAAARADLLWIAAALEHSHDPDPTCMAQLHNLLANPAGDSPLYNPHIPNSKLAATLQRIRDGLETEVDDPGTIEIEPASP